MFTKKVFQAQNVFSKSRCMSLLMLYGGLPVLSLNSSDVVSDFFLGGEPRKKSFCRFTVTLGRQVLGESNCV